MIGTLLRPLVGAALLFLAAQLALPQEAAAADRFSDETRAAFVVAIQEELRDAGFYHGPVDGKLGPATDAAIKAWQRAAGLPVTGVADMALLGRLRFGDPVAAPRPNPYVAWAQRMLIDQGYLEGVADGLMGPKTRAAVLRWQRDRNLAVDGMIGPETLGSLARASGATPPGTSDDGPAASPAPVLRSPLLPQIIAPNRAEPAPTNTAPDASPSPVAPASPGTDAMPPNPGGGRPHAPGPDSGGDADTRPQG